MMDISAIRTFECFTCWTSFLSLDESTEHRQHHHPFRPSNCVLCGQFFVMEECLLHHYRKHVERDIAASRRKHVEHDTATSHGWVNVDRILCSNTKHWAWCCDRGSPLYVTRGGNARNSQERIISELGVVRRLDNHYKPDHLSNCCLCGKLFKRKCDAKRHVAEVHFKVRFHCTICQRNFSRKRSLTRHLKRYHLDSHAETLEEISPGQAMQRHLKRYHLDKPCRDT